MILTFLKKTIRKIRIFFRRSLSKELLIFLIFLLISCFFWVLQSLQDVSEVEIEIPVSYTKVPDNIYITNKLPKTLKITLRDKGTNLYYTYRHRKEMTIRVNLMNWYRKDRIAHIPSSSFDAFLRNRMSSTTQLLRISPDTIAIYFVEKAVKTVPVQLKSRLSLSSQHFFSKAPALYPSIINIYAPADVLSNIHLVETDLLELEDLKDSMDVTVGLKPIEGVRFSTKSIQVKLNVEEFTEETLTIPVTGLNFPSGQYLLSFPPTVKVTFFVGLSSYKKIKDTDFEITVDHTDLMKSEKRSQKVKVTKNPSTIRNIRIQPEFVDCLIEKK